MKPAWTPRELERRETITAGLVAALVGAATGLAAFYTARLVLGREPLRLEPPEQRTGVDGG